ncbi:holo-[acyl-carrier protein] synthase [Elusimicrobium simillimum]|uniref:holo-ACP synthase n=1 Tax=Elusimicrobium simillimum TaxID=3143438 RepID=UPI003C6F58B9
MEIIGIGTDIVEVQRIAEFAENSAALIRIFSEAEIDYCLSKKNRYEHFAVRFAAKEAVYKALPFDGVALKKIEVHNECTGAPIIVFDDPRAKDLDIKISLSHTKKYATAVALITKK